MLNPTLATTLGPMRAPFLLLVPAVIALAWASAFYDGQPVRLCDLLLAFFGAMAAHISVNALNEYEDFRSGLDLHTKRTPFSGGTGTLPTHPEKAPLALLVGVVSLMLVFAVGAWFVYRRGPALIPLGLVGVALIVFYTRFLTRSPLWCLLAPGLAFGPIMVLGAYFALTGHYGVTPAVASLLPLFLVSNLLLMNQFPDQEADATVGRYHLLLARGPAAGVAVYGLFIAGAYASVLIAVLTGYLPLASLLVLLSLPPALLAHQGLRRHHADIPALVPHMAQNVALNLSAPLLLSLGLFLSGDGLARDEVAERSLSQLVNQQLDYDGRLVRVQGTLRSHPSPLHYWVEDDELHRVEISPMPGVTELLGMIVSVEGVFHYQRDRGRTIDVRSLVPVE